MKLARTIVRPLLALCLAAPLLLEPTAYAQDAADAAAAPATAPSGKRAELAEELLLLFGVDKTMESAFGQVGKMQERMIDPKLSPEDRAKRQEAVAAAVAETKEILSWEKLKPTFIKIYADVFTEEELQNMITFFKSPNGQAWIAKQPQLQAATMKEMQGLMMELQAKVKERVEAQRAATAPQPAAPAPQTGPSPETAMPIKQ